MQKINAAFNEFPYTADPYGYARRMTNVIDIGGIPIGGENELCILGKVGNGVSDKDAFIREIRHLYSLGCRIVIVQVSEPGAALKLNDIRNQLASEDNDVKLLIDTGSNFTAALAVVSTVEGIRVSLGSDMLNEKEFSKYRASFENLVRECSKGSCVLELYNSKTSENPAEIVEPLLEAARIAQKLKFNRIIFSLEAPDPVTTVQTYRYFAACLLERKWQYPIHLAIDIAKPVPVSEMQASAIAGSLLEDGIGDAIHISFGNEHSRTIELAFRIARRYTEIDWSLLNNAGISRIKETVSIRGVPTNEALNGYLRDLRLLFIPGLKRPSHNNGADLLILGMQ